MRRRFARLVLLLIIAPVLLAAAMVTGYAERPSADETAFQAYLLLGGNAADLCGDGHALEHDHCAGCQTSTPSLAAVGDTLKFDARPAQPTEFVLAQGRSGGFRILAASPRGPPGREDA